MKSFIKNMEMLCYKVKCKRKNGTMYQQSNEKAHRKHEWNRIQTNINKAVL